MYEYLSILIHFHLLQIIYEYHPTIKDSIIQQTQDYINTVKGLPIIQTEKDYRIGNYLFFTGRIIDLDAIGVNNITLQIPSINH